MVLRATGLVAAEARTVLAALTEPATLRAGLGRLGITVEGSGQLAVGEELRLRRPPLPGELRLRLDRADAGDLVVTAVNGPLPELSWSVTLAGTAAGTLVTTALRWVSPAGRAVDTLVARWIVLRLLTALVEAVTERSVGLAAARIVVGAVVIRDGGTVLAAQRSYPAEVAGRWEFPGGKVAEGESEAAALVRECREELGVTVAVGERVGPDLVLADDLVLRVYAARTEEDPTGLEHSALRWVGRDELAELDWLPADRVVLPQVKALLAERPARHR